MIKRWKKNILAKKKKWMKDKKGPKKDSFFISKPTHNWTFRQKYGIIKVSKYIFKEAQNYVQQ